MFASSKNPQAMVYTTQELQVFEREYQNLWFHQISPTFSLLARGLVLH